MDSQHRFKSPGELVSRPLTDIHALWAQLANGRLAPRRDELSPAVIRGLLPYTFVMDVIAQGEDFRFGFAGDRIIQFMGRRFAGMLLSEFSGTPIFDNMHRIYSACVKERRPLANGPMQANHEPKNFLEMEVLILPVSEDGAAVSAILGAMDTWPLGTNKPKPA